MRNEMHGDRDNNNPMDLDLTDTEVVRAFMATQSPTNTPDYHTSLVMASLPVAK